MFEYFTILKISSENLLSKYHLKDQKWHQSPYQLMDTYWSDHYQLVPIDGVMRQMTSKDPFNTEKPDFYDYKTGIPEAGKRFTVTNLIFEGQWWACVHVSHKYIKVRPKLI